MKSASVADLRNHFAELSHWLDEGESIRITKRGSHVATLVPARKEKAPKPWPNLRARLKKAFPNGPVKDSAELMDYIRGDY